MLFEEELHLAVELAALGHQTGAVPHGVEHVQVGRDVGGTERAVQADRTTEQQVAGAGGEQRRREALREVRVDGGDQRVLQSRLSRVEAGALLEGSVVDREDRVDAFESVDTTRPSTVARATLSEGKFVSAIIRSSPWPIARKA